jgi:hypothetical protein
MGIWEKANDISLLAYRISNVKDMVELVAADLQDPHSGALWGIRDALDDISQKIEAEVAELMRINREQQETPKKKKAK